MGGCFGRGTLGTSEHHAPEMRQQLAGAQNVGVSGCCWTQLSGCESWGPPEKNVLKDSKGKKPREAVTE